MNANNCANCKKLTKDSNEVEWNIKAHFTKLKVCYIPPC